MRMSTRVGLVASLVGAVAFGVGAIAHQVDRYATAFADTRNGESQVVVVDRFGQPSAHELKGQPFLRFSNSGCEAPCSQRLWWEHPVLRGVEAWSDEFDSENRVIHKAHWVSP